MTSQEFGELIRASREARGLSVEELAAKFKLSSKTLYAIENGVLEGLPHAVYARGFVRSYAQSVGLSPEDLETGIEALFPRAVLEGVAPTPGPIDRHLAAQRQNRGGDKIVALVIILVILVLPAAAGVFVLTRYGGDILDLIKRPLSASSTVTAPDAAVPQPADTTAVSRANGAGPANATTRPAASAPVAVPQPAPVPVPQAAAPVSPPAAGRNATAASPAEAAPAVVVETVPTDGNRVSVEAKAECYVQAMADGESPRTMHVYPGQTSVFPFKKKLVLVLGNGGGVTVRYNGKPYPLSARSGERVSLTFPPSR